MTYTSVQGHTGLTHPLIFWHLGKAPEYGTECFGRFVFARIRKSVGLKGLKVCSCWGRLFLGVLWLLWVQVEIAHRAYYYACCVWLMISKTRSFLQTTKFHKWQENVVCRDVVSVQNFSVSRRSQDVVWNVWVLSQSWGLNVLVWSWSCRYNVLFSGLMSLCVVNICAIYQCQQIHSV